VRRSEGSHKTNPVRPAAEVVDLKQWKRAHANRLSYEALKREEARAAAEIQDKAPRGSTVGAARPAITVRLALEGAGTFPVAGGDSAMKVWIYEVRLLVRTPSALRVPASEVKELLDRALNRVDWGDWKVGAVRVTKVATPVEDR
jgi:hypothetical protein